MDNAECVIWPGPGIYILYLCKMQVEILCHDKSVCPSTTLQGLLKRWLSRKTEGQGPEAGGCSGEWVRDGAALPAVPGVQVTLLQEENSLPPMPLQHQASPASRSLLLVAPPSPWSAHARRPPVGLARIYIHTYLHISHSFYGPCKERGAAERG